VICVCDESGPCQYHAQFVEHRRRAWWAWMARFASWARWAAWSALWRVEYPEWVRRHPQEQSDD